MPNRMAIVAAAATLTGPNGGSVDQVMMLSSSSRRCPRPGCGAFVFLSVQMQRPRKSSKVKERSGEPTQGVRIPGMIEASPARTTRTADS